MGKNKPRKHLHACAVKSIERIAKTDVIRRVKKDFPPERLIDTGSTMLNLACSDTVSGGFPLGSIVNLIGDSSSGKTLLCTTMLALAANKDRFKKYRLIYDDVERGNEFDINHLFGEVAHKRIGRPDPSKTVEEFLLNICDLLDEKIPFVWVLDSLDGLSDIGEQKRTREQQEARKKGNKFDKGTFAMYKAKGMSALLRQIMQRIDETDSLLVIISQTRDDVGAIFGSKKTTSGGKALEFYCHHRIWLSNRNVITKTIKKRKRELGHDVHAKVSKNRINGKRRTIEFRVLYDYGVDDTASMLNFMVKEGGNWGTKLKVEVPNDIISGTFDECVKYVEAKHPEILPTACQNLWNEIEEDFKIDRTRRMA